MEHEFLKKAEEIVEQNISNENFGVSELADELSMSRSNLLRKIKSQTSLSVSQFIRQIRLKHAMELLKVSDKNISTIAYEVGFSSPSYFIKCFHEFYGFPPGEANNQAQTLHHENESTKPTIRRLVLIIGTILFAIFVGVWGMLKLNKTKPETSLEKSIAVLPFINDSNDSTNVYIINGLMESILNNLQSIEDLRVISRTSVEKYRNTNKSIPEIAKELNVNYFIEGSGQKIGNEILLNVQLIEALTDDHIWAKQFNREVEDIFSIQAEVAKSIASSIKASITPEEDAQISKKPTENLKAYDEFLKALDYFYKGTREDLLVAIPLFQKAIKLDPEFAMANANLAITYYYLDVMQSEKIYKDSIVYYADRAMMYDVRIPQSLVAKGMCYMQNGEYAAAEPYLEKALVYSPNSAWVLNFLSDFYTTYYPNTEKYLEYALKGIRLGEMGEDSISTSFIYLHLSNALIQSGFVDEALKYINRSLDFDENNLYSEYVKAYILYARDKDLVLTRKRMQVVYSKDSTRLDILQELAKLYYYERDFENAYKNYSSFQWAKETYNLSIYPSEDIKMAYVYLKMGFDDEAKEFIKNYKQFAEADQSRYSDLSLSAYYAYIGDDIKALNHLTNFSKQDNFQYWVLLFLSEEPIFENIYDLPEFKECTNVLEEKFWKKYNKTKRIFEEMELL